MSLSSLGYFTLLPIVIATFYLVPAKLQNLVLFLSSIVFISFALPTGTQWFVPLVALGTVTTFIFLIAKRLPHSTHKKFLLIFGVGSCIGLLAIFKYYNAVLPLLFGANIFQLGAEKLALPLGISFYSFASIGYLVDVYRGDILPETSLLRFSVFTGFFATISSGPICRGASLLPQLQKPHRFDANRTGQALRLFALGLFKKVAVSDVLALYVNQVFEHYAQRGGLSLFLGAVGYSFVLYFDFCGYSEMARASALLLDIQIPENFKTPYFATNFSGFWSRWHISLSSWLQDYLFMPLVWGRWTSHLPIIGKKVLNPPMISSVAIVFLISGFWHGSTFPFVVWGILQACYRVGEELLHRFYGKPKKNPSFSLVLWKRASVFLLWSASLVFFKMGSSTTGNGLPFSIADGFQYLGGIFSQLSPQRFIQEFLLDIQQGFYAKPIMVIGWILFVSATLCFAFWLDWTRNKQKNKGIELVIAAQNPRLKWFIDYTLIIGILVGLIIQNGGMNAQGFAYANF